MPKQPKSKPKLNQRADGTLTCALGEDWIGPHPLCDIKTARMIRLLDEVPRACGQIALLCRRKDLP
jgi:hypothetical protein